MTYNFDIPDDRKGLIFDLDGTLVDTMPLHFRSWQHIAEMKEFTFTEELFYALAGTPTPLIIDHLNRELGLSLDREEILRLKYEGFNSLLAEAQLVEEVVAVAESCHGKLPLAVGTGGIREIAELTLKLHCLDRLFPVLVCAEDVARHKPAPDTFLRCAELMGVPPETCHVFEDGEQGIRAAGAAGMTVTDVRPAVYRQRERCEQSAGSGLQ